MISWGVGLRSSRPSGSGLCPLWLTGCGCGCRYPWWGLWTWVSGAQGWSGRALVWRVAWSCLSSGSSKRGVAVVAGCCVLSVFAVCVLVCSSFFGGSMMGIRYFLPCCRLQLWLLLVNNSCYITCIIWFIIVKIYYHNIWAIIIESTDGYQKHSSG